MARARLAIAAVAMALISTVCPSASSQPADEGQDPKALAQQLFKKGRDEVKKPGGCKRAIVLFQQSLRVLVARGTLFNLAKCEEKLGKLASAWQHYQQLDKMLEPSDERAPIAKKKVAELGPRIPKLRIRLAEDAPAETKVRLGDLVLDAGSLGVELPVDPGLNLVVVTASEREDNTYELKLAEAARKDLTVAAGPPKKAAVPAPPTPTAVSTAKAAPRSGSLAPGIIVGAVGLAAVGASAATGVMAIGKKDDLEQTCPVPAQCTADGVELADSGQTLATVSTITMVAGVVGVGVGLTLLLTIGRDEEPEDSSSTPASPPEPVALSLVPLPGGASLWLEGRF